MVPANRKRGIKVGVTKLKLKLRRESYKERGIGTWEREEKGQRIEIAEKRYFVAVS